MLPKPPSPIRRRSPRRFKRSKREEEEKKELENRRVGDKRTTGWSII